MECPTCAEVCQFAGECPGCGDTVKPPLPSEIEAKWGKLWDVLTNGKS